MTKEQAIEELRISECYSVMPSVEALDMAIKALEQQPCDDVMAIHTQGLDEGIRCAMCTNSMKSDRGCDGGCVVDEDMYKKVMETINNQMFSQSTSDNCVSRQAVDQLCFEYLKPNTDDNIAFYEHFLDLPPIMPTFPKDTTNGDIIKIIFPNIEANEVKTDTGGYIEVKYLDTTDKCDATAFRKNWWNAPYRG